MIDSFRSRFSPRRVLMYLLALSLGGVIGSNSCAKREQRSDHRSLDPAIVSQIMAQYPEPLSLSPDGSEILLRKRTSNSDELLVVKRKTGRAVAKTESPDTYLALSWSPDGKRLAYLADDAGNGRFHLFIWNLQNGFVETPAVPVTEAVVQPPKWDARGTRLAYLVGNYVEGTIWILEAHGRSSPRPVLLHVRTMSDFELSPNGQEIAAVQIDAPAVLHIKGVHGLNAVNKRIVFGLHPFDEIRDMAWDPSGKKLVVTTRTGSGNFLELKKVNVESQTVVGCASAEGDIVNPHVAWDGSTIVYTVSAGAQSTLYSTRCDGTAPRRIGFQNGTTRFIKFLSEPNPSSSNAESFVARHDNLKDPPCLYKVSVASGKPNEVYCPPDSARLESPTPQIIGIPAPDGSEIPTVYWRGKDLGKRSHVVVVDIHGGPFLEQKLRWELLPTILASRGVDVLAPNYRGSSGYGFRYEVTGNLYLQLQEITAVCKYAKSLYGGISKIVLFGTSYGANLAALTATADPGDMSGVFLVSITSQDVFAPRVRSSPPLTVFHGENDFLPPAKAHQVIQFIFGPDIFAQSSTQWLVLPKEGHVFRQVISWAKVYTQLVRMVTGIAASSEKEGEHLNAAYPTGIVIHDSTFSPKDIREFLGSSIQR